ncbi:hypothetical protein CC78DRAFT_286502 [Lojkania enalia]|uniref:Plasma membrane fusion protein PRM1 n=1 Tax=Lojkania enalia TaxID=147567 RepID=A0A9P4N317_9PLEO|nr:hypothetical protein CC78DRAFT_286502 [Didymosphaeria enalia]
MASAANQQQSFPAVPPSLSAGDHEMRDYYAPQAVPRPAINHAPYLTPYLGLRARLSQIWINRWTILLILVLIRLLFAIASINDSLSSARREALSACIQVENIGSSMASMPHYMSQGLNDMTATGIEKAVSGLMTMLDMSVTGVEEIALFVIHMMTSTYLCLITLAVRGSVGAAVEVGKKLSEGLNKTIDEVTGGISSGVKDVTDAINKFKDGLNSLPFTDSPLPSIDLGDEINRLKDLKGPPEIEEGLQNLQKSIPTFDEVQNFTDNLIRLPFEEVKKLIRGMDTFEFDRQLLPVPQKERLNFCSENNSINDFFDSLVEMEISARKIALGVLILLAILICIPMAWAEIRRYRRMEERAGLFQKGHDAMDVVYLASRPHSSTWGLWLGRRFGSSRRQAIVRWTWAYATSVPMLFLISLGIAGLFSCLCQYILLRGIQQKVPELTGQVANFAEDVITSLNNASMSWSTGVNGAIDKLDSEINGEILGWVNTTTKSINDTLNGFVSETSNVLKDVFGNTPLEEPIKEVLNCLIGLKIASFQKGLTWVQEHAHVSFPGVKNDTLSIKALAEESDSETAAELLADPNGKAKDEVTEAITHIVDKIISGIKTEALISLGLILIWVFIGICGLIYAFTLYPRQYRLSLESGDAYRVDPATDDVPKAQEYPDTAAPPYEYPVNKAAPYTIQPRPFPIYDPNDLEENQSEKVGQVGAYHAVAESARPGHLRSSSHGQMAQPSPLEENQNPFASPRDEKRDPFAN